MKRIEMENWKINFLGRHLSYNEEAHCTFRPLRKDVVEARRICDDHISTSNWYKKLHTFIMSVRKYDACVNYQEFMFSECAEVFVLFR